MIHFSLIRCASFALLAASGIALSGCGSSETGPVNVDSTTDTGTDHSHGGWWCVEHGVPEEECAQCNSSLAAKFKSDSDWCEEHNRPESQCFLCSTARFDKFAARYEAKTGHKPPKPIE
jgi:hypothetical protein